MATRRKKLGTRSQVVAEIERLYNDVWELSAEDVDTKAHFAMLTKLLELALKASDDSDLLGTVRALGDKVDELESRNSHPRAAVVDLDSRRSPRGGA